MNIQEGGEIKRGNGEVEEEGEEEEDKVERRRRQGCKRRVKKR